MNNLCREYRSQMLLSLTKLFGVIKCKHIIQKSQVFNMLSTKAKIEVLANSFASEASDSLQKILLERMHKKM